MAKGGKSESLAVNKVQTGLMAHDDSTHIHCGFAVTLYSMRKRKEETNMLGFLSNYCPLPSLK